jgi:nucleotidyltransferase substrate binding protein (TIGR01987 family)
MKEDVRWIQRFSNFKKALSQLKSAVELSEKRMLTELEEQGLIQSFEYTHELAWNTIKDFLEEQGYTQIYGSKDTIRKAFNINFITEGDVWMDMIKSRNLSTHTYNRETVKIITDKIIESYFKQFLILEDIFLKIRDSK